MICSLTQLQEIFANASKAPKTAKDQSPWLYINDTDTITDDTGAAAGSTSLAAATIMAPGWAHWTIGDLVKKDGKDVREWNPEKFGTFVLPGTDGQPAPVFAGCLLYTSDAADERSSVDLGGRRIIKKKKSTSTTGRTHIL